MEGRSDGNLSLKEGVTPGTEEKSPPVRGIGLRVTNIEGNNLFPRRGMYSTNNSSILDGLFEISKPVEVDVQSACGGKCETAMQASHANPSGVPNVNPNTAEKGLLNNQIGAQGSQNVQRVSG
ncbi:hypothetical protein Hanom_Chr03g00214681 [Helianthus anomalus]